uniref:Uncharacterized protein n=1 Tax=Arundo donax TaxID=35708 RepID=A0A0A9HMW1_ARUDO
MGIILMNSVNLFRCDQPEGNINVSTF